MELLILKNKKANFNFIFVAFAILFAVSIFLLFLNKAFSSMSSDLTNAFNSAGFQSNETVNSIGSSIKLFDYMIPFLLLGLFLFVGISAFFYFRMGYLSIVIGAILLIIVGILSLLYSDIYSSISSSQELSDSSNDFQITNYIMDHLTLILGVMVVLVSLILLLKPSPPEL